MLIQYVRDEDKTPLGVVVAVGSGQLGFAKRNPKDAWDKELGKRIAIGRATHPEIAMRDVLDTIPEKAKPLFSKALLTMMKRSQRYFKGAAV